ncbi:hypothetical protein MMC26_004715 [Xylographa opegraphella]|nr:hypothetical protein [Xylographa opegraphella]
MASDHVIRIPRSDIHGEYVIINVSSNGPALLDLKLIGTEGTNPYLETVKESGVSKLLLKNSSVTISQWEAILHTILVQERPTASAREALANLEVVASLVGDQLSIVFRKNISGIQQRVGEIVLKQDDDQEIDTIAWLKTAICHADSLEGEFTELSNKFREQNELVKKLNLQIEDLITAQQQYVSSSLERFMVLLNAKKLKIRDQQRLLATAKVDSKLAQAVRAARYSSTGAHPETSRPNKRKQRIEPAASVSGSEDTEFGDVAAEYPDSVTPEQSDLEVASDDDDLHTGTRNELSRSGTGHKGKALEGAPLAMDVDEPPPRRELPFSTIGRKEIEEKPETISAHKSSKGDRKEADVEDERSLDGYETSDDEL